MRHHAIVFMVALAGAASCAPAPNSTSGKLDGTIVDLSHEYSDQAIFWPTAESFRLDKVADGMTPQGYYYAANNFAGAEHGGTHIDAPVHFAQGRWSVEQIPPDRLIGEAAVVDLSAASASQPDYQISVADLTTWEQAHGSLDDTILLLRTDYSARWPDAARYLGTAERGERRRGQAALSRLTPGGREVAGGEPARQGRRHRHGEHRLRAVDVVRDASRAVRTKHPRSRKPREPGPPAAARRDADCAAHEDQGRQRRTASSDRNRSYSVAGIQ